MSTLNCWAPTCDLFRCRIAKICGSRAETKGKALSWSSSPSAVGVYGFNLFRGLRIGGANHPQCSSLCVTWKSGWWGRGRRCQKENKVSVTIPWTHGITWAPTASDIDLVEFYRGWGRCFWQKKLIFPAVSGGGGWAGGRISVIKLVLHTKHGSIKDPGGYNVQG